MAQLLGWTYFPWQCHVADVAGEYDPVTKLPSYRTVGVGVARQNGKTTLVCSRIARQLIPPRQTVAYTAQDRGLARTKWGEHVDILMSTAFANRVARIDRVNHRECLTMENGSRYMPVTPSPKKAARSLSIDLAVVDEAHAHEDMGVISAIQPAMAARAYAQIWILSNAGNSKSGLWRHYTDVGRLEVNNPASSMCWFEYAAEGQDVDRFDHGAWGEANPSMGHAGGVLETALSDGALTMDRDIFFREHLNVWMDTAEMAGIDAATWEACRNDKLVPTTDIAFALDFTTERDAGALVVAGAADDDVTPIEIVQASTDIPALIRRTIEVAKRWDAVVVMDRGSPAGSAIPLLEDQGVSLHLITQVELLRACGDFFDAAAYGRLSHNGDYRLAEAVTGATKRKLGDGWVWQRRGRVNISPLMAATLARWGMVGLPKPLTPKVW